MRCSLDSDIAYYNLLSKYETEMLPKCTDSIKMLEDLLEKYKNVAITCFESKVSHCHRSKIGKLMKANGYEVSDI